MSKIRDLLVAPKAMKKALEAFPLLLQEVPTETAGTIGTMGRHHAPLRLAYERIRADMSLGTCDQECLQLAFIAVNCMIGPGGLCPAQLALGTVP